MQTIYVDAWERGTGRPLWFVIHNYPNAIIFEDVFKFIQAEGYELDDLCDVDTEEPDFEDDIEVIKLAY